MSEAQPTQALLPVTQEGRCKSCSCDACREHWQRLSNLRTVEKDANSRCWSCSCGWTGCYTRADITKYGEPSECNWCCRERLEETAHPRLATPTPAAQPNTTRFGTAEEWRADLLKGQSPAPKALTDPLKGIRLTRVGRFGHHPDPATDYEVEVDALTGMAENRRRGVNPEPDLVPRIKRALDFIVGGVPSCVAARGELLKLDAEFQS